jgi:hypothetical protein
MELQNNRTDGQSSHALGVATRNSGAIRKYLHAANAKDTELPAAILNRAIQRQEQ